MRKVILFDWGGVVETSYMEYSTIRDIMYSLGCSNVDEELIYDRFHVNSSTSCFDTITNMEEYNKALKEFLCLFSGDVEVTDEIVEKYKKTYSSVMVNNPYYQDVSEYAQSLSDRCEIGILSNVQLIDKKRQNRHLNYDSFKYVFLSCDIGLAKPGREIFLYVNEKIGDADILFLDDNENNLKVPRELGWKTYQVQKGGDIDNIKRVCNEFLGGEE